MTETEFIELAESTLQRIQSAVEAVDDDLDVDRQGNVLTIEFDDGFQIVINMQTPTRQLWLASLKGGHHYERSGQEWLDTCSRHSITEDLSALLTQKLGRVVKL
jgi:CyaY protein